MMIRSFVFFTLLIAIHGLKYSEKNVEVTTDDGTTVTCSFVITYTADPFVLNKKKSKITCKPKVSGIGAQILNLPEVGDVDFEFQLKKGKGTVKKAELVPEEPSGPSGPTGSVPMNCSCVLPLDSLMPEMPEAPAPIAGRGLRLIQSRLANSVLLAVDQETNKKIATFQSSDRAGLIGLILLPILLPQIIAAIQAALAGRSLNIETEERREQLEKILEQLEAAQERVDEIVGDRDLIADFIKTCNNNANGANFITNLTAFITAIQGLLAALGIGRSLPVNAHNRQFGSGPLAGLLGSGGLTGGLEGLGGSAPSPPPPSPSSPSTPLLDLLAGSSSNGGDLSGLLGALGGSNGGGDFAPLLEALAGSNGGSGDLTSLLGLLGGANGGSGDLAPLLSLLTGSDSSLIEGIISNVIQQQIDSVLSDLDPEAMVDELLAEFGINGGIEEALAELETMEQEFDAMIEEFLAEVEAELAGGFGEDLRVPLQCDCVPYEVMAG